MESKGEKRIKDILLKEKLSFKQEYIFKDLKSYRGKPLRFDFIVFKDNKRIAIEFHGAQHYNYVKYFSKSKKKWNYQREMDLKKAEYCLKNDIPLYVIPYTEFENINSIEDIFQEKFRIKTKWYIYQGSEGN